MEMRNLEINILYRLCEEMTKGRHCGPVSDAAIYRVFPDLPAGLVSRSILYLVDSGWLRQDADQLYLTERGLSEIRAFIPEPLLPICDPPDDCPM